MKWRRTLALAVILLLALGLRLAQWSAARPDPAFEQLSARSQEYDRQGWEIATGQRRGAAAVVHAPLYPYFLAVLYKTFDHDLAAVFGAQILLSVLGCAILYQAGSRFGDAKLGLAAAALAAIYPVFHVSAVALATTTLDVTLTCFLLAAVAGAWRRRDASTWLTVGLACALLVLLGERYLLLVPFLVGLAFFHGGKIGLRRNLGLLFGLAVVLLPIAVHQYRLGGDPTPAIFAAEHSAVGESLGRFWSWTEPTDGSLEGVRQQPLPRLLRLQFGTLCILAVAGLWWLRRHFVHFLPVLVFVAATTVATVLYFTAPDDRVAVVPGLMLLAALPLRALWFAVRQRRWWDVAALELLVVVAVAAPWWV